MKAHEAILILEQYESNEEIIFHCWDKSVLEEDVLFTQDQWLYLVDYWDSQSETFYDVCDLLISLAKEIVEPKISITKKGNVLCRIIRFLKKQ